MRWCMLIWFPFTFFFLSTVPAKAQDMKIRTHVYGVSPVPGKGMQEQERAVSLTVFHAGRVYDYIDSVGEVIIFEPTQNRFTILSSARSLVTTVDFDELRQMLKVAKHESEKYLAQLEEQESEQAQDVAASIRNQLYPEFKENWKPISQELQLSNPQFNYIVKCETSKDQIVHETFLRYVDWMARLNYVLDPQSMFPEARIRLNEALRQRQLYPLEVKLFLEPGSKNHLRAEHTITWKLDATDRMLIHDWETRLNSPSIRKVSFREYQKALLVSSRSK